MLGERPLRRQILTVSQLTRDIKIILENSLPQIWVVGEVSNLAKPASGHIYFTLKDSSTQIRAVFFKEQNRLLKFEIKDGMQLICCGRIRVYEKAGSYQLYIKLLEPKGIGALQLAFEQLKARLAKQGLFDVQRKRSIPSFPRQIAIITSPTGAVIHDMLNILKRRSISIEVTLFCVSVQGQGAAEEMAQAVDLANKYGGFDLLLLARGGGSLEDLWAFNEEVLARSIFASQIPTVSAVGHEVDWTICDLVSDMRAATPSAAIEMIIPSRDELRKTLQDLSRRLAKYIQELVPQYQQRLDDLIISLERRVSEIIERKDIELKGFSDRLRILSPLNILGRGYSITFDKKSGHIIKDGSKVRKGQGILTFLARGNLESVVTKNQTRGKISGE